MMAIINSKSTEHNEIHSANARHRDERNVFASSLQKPWPPHRTIMRVIANVKKRVANREAICAYQSLRNHFSTVKQKKRSRTIFGNGLRRSTQS